MEHRMPGIYDDRGRGKYLTLEESLRFKEEAMELDSRDRTLCLLLLCSGVRVSEALCLKRSDLDLSAGEIIVRTLKQRDSVVYRRIPIPEFLAKEIDGLKKHPRHRLWKLSRSMAWHIVKGIMRKAEIKGIHATCKGLRHSYGVRSVMMGVPVTTLQTLMGHRKIETTTIYLNIVGEELRRVVKVGWEILFD